jgi:hypothetical protein
MSSFETILRPLTMTRGDVLWHLARERGVTDIPAYITKFGNVNPSTNPDLICADREYPMPFVTQP